MASSKASSKASIIHPTAIVSDGAELGEGVQVGPYSIIGPEVSLGSGTRIESHVVIAGKTKIGENNRIFQFASIGAEPQDLKYKNEPSRLEIGDSNTIREYVTIQPGTEAGEMITIIGSYNLFMASSHVGHDAVLGDRIIVANSAALSGHVQVGSHVTIGGLVGIHQFVRIGSHAFIGGGAMVAQDVPPFCLAQGDRALLFGINIIGLKRRGFDTKHIQAIKEGFRAVFYQKGKLREKIESVRLDEKLMAHESIGTFLDFIEASERGIASVNSERAST